MRKHQNLATNEWKTYRPLVAAALAVGGTFQLLVPVLAAGTSAGQLINNQATATYQDDGGNTFDTISNTVTVTVAEIAGITNTPNGFNGTATDVLSGDSVDFDFLITNTGNDASDIFIPGSNNITTTGLSITSVQIIDPNGGFTTVTVPADGLTFGDADGSIAGGLLADASVIVRVTGTVTATAAGAPISVQLGNTGSNSAPNAPEPDSQNQPNDGTAPDVLNGLDEVRTVNVGAQAPAVSKEASATQQFLLGANSLALPIIRKTHDPVLDPLGTPTDLTDDLIPYNLELEVSGTSPNSLFTPEDLEGQDLTVTGIADDANLILISDAIPAGTSLITANGPNGEVAPAAPSNWTVVYTIDDLSIPADQATWTTTAPANGITRIGFVYDARPTTDGGNGPLANGDPAITGFTFQVKTDQLAAGTTNATIAGIAQVFGTNDDGAAGTSGTPVFDESGDANPSNLNDDGSIGPGDDADVNGEFGVADPAADGVDTGNDNSALNSPGGEANVVTLAAAGVILNGPASQPAALGDVFGTGADNNHDFQNASVSPTVDEAGAPVVPTPDNGVTYDPAPISL
ncbi:MAG: hypothetical protein F6K19_38075, partial [Cyanothece sp. SIO1E1]|nr:hypothetical protein [Cyanothece sp. SIO1E1]